MAEDLKTCSRCRNIKPLNAFGRLKRGGLRERCKACAAEDLRAWRLANADRLKAERKEQYRALTPEQREAKRAYGRAKYSEYKDRQREDRLKRQFGIDTAAYQALLSAQDGRCAICRSGCTTGRRLAVDHDHTTGAVRGLLCANCNRALGLFKDSTEALLTAVHYLLADRENRS